VGGARSELYVVQFGEIKRILDSCKQKPFESDVGFPSSITVKGSECGRGSERTVCSAVRWEGLGVNWYVQT